MNRLAQVAVTRHGATRQSVCVHCWMSYGCENRFGNKIGHPTIKKLSQKKRKTKLKFGVVVVQREKISSFS